MSEMICDYCDDDATDEGPDGEPVCENHYYYTWEGSWDDEYPENWNEDE